MFRLAFAVLFFASAASAQHTLKYGPKSSQPPGWWTSGVFHPDKRVKVVHQYLAFEFVAGKLELVPKADVYMQPFDFIPPVSTEHWYPIGDERWSDGARWIERWAIRGYTSVGYTLKYVEPPK
jgi:hypothetical protein